MTRDLERPETWPSATHPDWSREACGRWEWKPTRQLLRTVRDYQRLGSRRDPAARLLRKTCALRHRFWSAVCGADVPLNCKLGGGLHMPHPFGIVIHPNAEIGPNCLLFQGVTVGTGGPIPGSPTLEGHVDVGAGAKILGGVHIGADAKIGANAVVLCDVPAGATATGVPAKVSPPPRSETSSETERAASP